MNRAVLWLLSFLLIGCVPGASEKKSAMPAESVMTQALKLIDQGRPEEAALLLEDLSEQQPGNDEIDVALASAYASCAGLKMSSFYDLFYELIFARPLAHLQSQSGSQKYRSLIGKKQTIDAERFQVAASHQAPLTLQKIREALLLSFQLMDVFAKLPEVVVEKEIFVRQSLHVLENLQQPKKAHYAYRSLLRATLLKADLHRRFEAETASSDCNIDVIGLIDDLEVVDGQLVSLFTDLGLAFPRERPQLRRIKEELHESVVSLRNQIQRQGKSDFKRSVQSYLILLESQRCEVQ